MQNERWLPAGAYVLASVALCLLGTALGLRLAQALVGSRA
jgi:fluoride ion exporter CrcB/FEX